MVHPTNPSKEKQYRPTDRSSNIGRHLRPPSVLRVPATVSRTADTFVETVTLSTTEAPCAPVAIMLSAPWALPPVRQPQFRLPCFVCSYCVLHAIRIPPRVLADCLFGFYMPRALIVMAFHCTFPLDRGFSSPTLILRGRLTHIRIQPFLVSY